MNVFCHVLIIIGYPMKRKLIRPNSLLVFMFMLLYLDLALLKVLPPPSHSLVGVFIYISPLPLSYLSNSNRL